MARKDDDERSPQEWREMLKTGYDYPEEARKGRRRDRRQARRDHRQGERRRTAEWIKTERQREPVTAAGALLIVVVVLALGVAAKWLWPGLVGTEHARKPVTVTAGPQTSAQDDKPAGTPSASSSPTSPRPSPTVDLRAPDKVAQQAVEHYLTRNPPVDRNHSAAVLRAAPWMTPSLVENLASNRDPRWDKLVSQGGVSTVRAVQVGPAAPGLPVDTPLRVWRKVTATVAIEGYTATTETTVLQTELTLDGEKWRVSRIVGL
ncbi:hypothetical protein QMK19_33995 [Streptomyces sp. H10-C2]|uniref:hypothetical protein n=1 Tax=unclassified Streptomyces TaxID=2593676 RepID=UPI0024BBE3FA|nr:MULTISPECIES: hypothetical protein [unclassified Streptomyces]MDJ0345561.1 hypothetical protein [Streptomyces sp. PH10-H1]MDJ0374507.1 hypothetical protein [Streptomyces sp. H10-C2]